VVGAMQPACAPVTMVGGARWGTAAETHLAHQLCCELLGREAVEHLCKHGGVGIRAVAAGCTPMQKSICSLSSPSDSTDWMRRPTQWRWIRQRALSTSGSSGIARGLGKTVVATF